MSDKNYGDYEKELLNNPKSSILKVILYIIGLSMLVGAILWITDLVITPAKTAKDVIQKTLSADNVLQNYEWFKQQVQDYNAINQKIATADSSVKRFSRDAGSRDKWTFETRPNIVAYQPYSMD